jgi:hypothetical protein
MPGPAIIAGDVRSTVCEPILRRPWGVGLTRRALCPFRRTRTTQCDVVTGKKVRGPATGVSKLVVRAQNFAASSFVLDSLLDLHFVKQTWLAIDWVNTVVFVVARAARASYY